MKLCALVRLLCGAAFLSLFLIVSANAATFNVPSSLYPTIQSGVNASSDGDTVLVADGTYTGTGNRDIDFKGKNITVTSQNGPTKTIIDCGGTASTDGSGNHRGFYIHSGETNVTISGFTVKNGYENGKSAIINSNRGGGICIINSGGTITLTKCTVSGNFALTGGGICNENNGTGGTIMLTKCIVSGNSATAGGGGIYNYNYYSNRGTIVLTDCTISGNSTAFNEAGGGGVYNQNESSDSSTITLTNCPVTGNSAVTGGGIYNYNYLSKSYFSNGNLITLTNCTITANTASIEGGGVYALNTSSNGNLIALTDCTITANAASDEGGGVANDDLPNALITLTNCTITANTARYGSGGGVYNENDGSSSTITLTKCNVSGNIAQSGGGIYNYNNGGGTITLTNCAVTGNTANYNGGSGIFNLIYSSNISISSGTITLTNCTISGNTASYDDGGIHNYSNGGTITLTNDIVYGNTGGEIVSYTSGTASINASFSDIQGGYLGASNIDKDPLFVDTTAGDLHLKPGSPCLGAGNPTGAPSTDIDGNPRPSHPSIGAYELGVGATVIHLTADNVTGDADGIVCDNLNGIDVSLKDTLTVTLSDPNAVITDESVTNSDGTVKDRHNHFNVGTFVGLPTKVVYFPPDEFNFEQQPAGVGKDETGQDWITKAATRTIKLTVHYTSSGKSLTATKDIILARPPTVLVHGINSDPSKWQPFINTITASGFGEPFVTVNHSDPKAYQGIDFTAVPGGLFGGNAPVEIGADLLSQRIQTTLSQVHQGSALSDADENSGLEINTTTPFLNPGSANGQSYRLASKRVDVVAWSYGGVITRWYINSGVPTNPATGQPISQSWYAVQPEITWGDVDSGYHDITFPVLPNDKYRNDIRKVITLGSMWRGVPLANYANEVLFPPTNAVALRDASLNLGADILGKILAIYNYNVGTTLGQLVDFLDTKLPVKPQHAHSMQVIAVNSPWLSELIYHGPTPEGVPTPFDAGIAYGSVAGDDNWYPLADISGFRINFDTYTALDLSTSFLLPDGTSVPPYSWFPYLSLEHYGDGPIGIDASNPNNYSDGIVPVWSSAIPGSYTLAPSTHKDYSGNLDTQNYVVQYLNSAALPLGSELNRIWNDPTSWNNPQDAVTVQNKTWQYTPSQMAPAPQSDLYQQIGRVGRINPTALREINTATVSSVGANSAIVGWVTATATDSKVFLYQLAIDGLPSILVKQTSVAEKTKNHQILITGLSTNTKYYYQVESTYDNSPDASITLASPAANLPSFRTTTMAQPDILVSVTRRDLVHNQFDLNFVNTGGTALNLSITNLNFSVSGYQIAGPTAPPSLQRLGPAQRITVTYSPGASSPVLLVRVNYKYTDINGSPITANTSYLRLK